MAPGPQAGRVVDPRDACAEPQASSLQASFGQAIDKRGCKAVPYTVHNAFASRAILICKSSVVSGGALALCCTTTLAAPLSVVNVSSPAINCIFDTTCKVQYTDTVGTIPIPGISGTARLQTRTFPGAAGARAAGTTGYEYRLDLTEAVGIVSTPCITALNVDFGPVTSLDYNKNGTPDQVFVVTSGSVGTVGLSGASEVGSVITFTLASPVCVGPSPGKGESSYFFGLASVNAPKAITAQVQIAGGPLTSVAARAPIH